MPPLSDCGDGVRRCEQEKRQRGGVGGESKGMPVVLYNKSLFRSPCKESSVRWPRASGIRYRANEFFFILPDG